MKNKSMSYLIETELEKAEVILAAKSITSKLQTIAEQLARIDANEIMPLGDAMRETFGGDAAEDFEQAVAGVIRELTEKVRDSRNEISDRIEALNSGQPMNDLSSGEDLFPEDDDDIAPEPEMDDEEDFDLSAAEKPAEDAGDLDELFGDEEESDPSGRLKKESREDTRNVLESKKAIVSVFSKLLNEGKTPKDAINLIAEKCKTSVSNIKKIVLKK